MMVSVRTGTRRNGWFVRTGIRPLHHQLRFRPDWNPAIVPWGISGSCILGRKATVVLLRLLILLQCSLYSSFLRHHYVKFLDIFGRDFSKLGLVQLYGETQKQEDIFRG